MTALATLTVTIACIRDVSERKEQVDRDRRHAEALE